jgi:O-methyltransferase domain
MGMNSALQSTHLLPIINVDHFLGGYEMAQAETEKLTRIVLGAALSRAVCTVAELGVADQIKAGSPQPVESLARVTGTHERSLYRILRFLASHGIFQEQGDRRFDHTPLSHCLRSDAEGSFRAAAQMMHRIFPAWDGLHHAALTGESGFNKVFEQPMFDYVGAHPDLAPVLDAGMTAIHGYETAAMMEAYDFSPIRVLADIGGGNGSLIGSVLQRYPKLNGILFDLGHVVGRARESLKAYGIGDRCSVIEGSFFESVPGGADAYLFRHIIHDWTDEQSIHILSNCRKVIPGDGRLLIVEAVVPTGNEPSLAKDFDMTMLTFPGGIERTEEEYRSLFEQAGFQLSSITPTASIVSVIEGKPR